MRQIVSYFCKPLLGQKYILVPPRFVAIEQLRSSREDSLRVLISNEQVYFLGRSDPDKDNIVLKVTYAELYNCRSIPYGTFSLFLLHFKSSICKRFCDLDCDLEGAD